MTSRASTDPRERAREIFTAARVRSAGPERDAFLQEACGQDDELRLDVVALLQIAEENAVFMAQPAALNLLVGNPTDVLTEKPGDAIGPYTLREVIGEGGWGIVYVAEQEQPVRRRVALKVIKPGMDTRAVIARFEAERQALAMMDHPNIAKFFEAGVTQPHSSLPSGRPYFVMELVRGIRITDYCEQNHLTVQARLDLFVKVCQAVQHAHQKGIIHRDLKPSNILVTLHDGIPVPKVIDFGIAKAIEGRLADKTVYTELHQFIGTPAYMSPEQAEMSGLDIDTRSDIYSLGVLLYELLTGKPPFDVKAMMSAGIDAMRKAIRELEPPRPSTRLTTELAAIRIGRSFPPAPADERITTELNRRLQELRGDLDWIVMKALEKDRTRRYETASGLARDIQHHLAHEPVSASPPGAAYRFKKLVRRNRVLAGSVTAVALALLAGVVVSSWQAIVATSARKAAEVARAAEIRERTTAEAERTRAQDASARAEQEKQVAQRNAYAAAMLAARADWEGGNITHLQRVLEETASYPEKGFEWYFWQRLCRTDLLTYREHDGPVATVAFSPDGAFLATAGEDQTIHIWDANTSRTVTTIRGDNTAVQSLAYSPDGNRLCSTTIAGTIHIWDAETGRSIRRFAGRAGAFTPNGDQILLIGVDGRLTLREIVSGRELADFGRFDGIARDLTVGGDSATLITEDAAGEVLAWRIRLGAPGRIEGLWRWQIPLRATEIPAVAVSPDGRLVATSGLDRAIRVWESAGGREIATLNGHRERIVALTFSRDGTRLASASRDQTIRVWDLQSRAELVLFQGHTEFVNALAYSPDRLRLASASQDRTVKIWDATNPQVPRVPRIDPRRGSSQFCPEVTPPDPDNRFVSTSGVQLVRFSPDGRHILSANKSGLVQIWDAQTLAELRALCGHTAPLSHANYSPNGRQISSGGHDRTLRLWDAESGGNSIPGPTRARSIGAKSARTDGPWPARGKTAVSGSSTPLPDEHSVSGWGTSAAPGS